MNAKDYVIELTDLKEHLQIACLCMTRLGADRTPEAQRDDYVQGSLCERLTARRHGVKRYIEETEFEIKYFEKYVEEDQ